MSKDERDRHPASNRRGEDMSSLLSGDPEVHPLRPMWPAVQSGLRRENRPVWTLPFAIGSGALATAGLALGIWAGTLLTPVPGVVEEDLWIASGSTLTQDSVSLYDSTLEPAEEGSEVIDE